MYIYSDEKEQYMCVYVSIFVCVYRWVYIHAYDAIQNHLPWFYDSP